MEIFVRQRSPRTRKASSKGGKKTAGNLLRKTVPKKIDLRAINLSLNLALIFLYIFCILYFLNIDLYKTTVLIHSYLRVDI